MANLMYLGFDVPTFHIESIRSAHTDTLYATTSCIVHNQDGSVYHDFGSKTIPLGDHSDKQTVSLVLPMAISIPPPPTPLSMQNPGVSVAWSFILTNSGHHGDLTTLTKGLNAGASALAGGALSKGAGALTGGTAVGPSSTGDTSASANGGGGSSFSGPLIMAAIAAAIAGIAELISLLTADCDGVVAQQTYKWTAYDLFHMVMPGKTWTQVKGNAGTTSPSGCGNNSKYDLTFRVREIPAPPIVHS